MFTHKDISWEYLNEKRWNCSSKGMKYVSKIPNEFAPCLFIRDNIFSIQGRYYVIKLC